MDRGCTRYIRSAYAEEPVRADSRGGGAAGPVPADAPAKTPSVNVAVKMRGIYFLADESKQFGFAGVKK